jgi:hypothetical protein
MHGGAVRSYTRFLQKCSPQTVIGWRLAVEVFAIFQGDLGVVGNDLVFSRTLEKENVTERDASQVFQVFACLDVLLQLEPFLVDEDVNTMVLVMMMVFF